MKTNHMSLQTRKLPNEYNQKFSTYSEKQIQYAFSEVKKTSLPFEYIKDCCFERGYAISYQLQSLGFKHLRVIVTGQFNNIQDQWGRSVEWKTHTSPAIISHTGEIWIIDPAINDQSIRLHEWLSKIMNPQVSHRVSLMNQYLYSEDEIDTSLNIESFERNNIWEVVNGSLLGCQVLQDQLNLRHKVKDQVPVCQVLPQSLKHAKENLVSDYWAQLLIGLDLSQDLISEIQRYRKLNRPIIHIWDSKLETESLANNVHNHAFSVLSFFKSGHHSSTNITEIGMTEDVVENHNSYPEVINKLNRLDATQLINLSASWGRFNSQVYETIEKLSHKKSILVQANGNHSLMGLKDSSFEPEFNNFIRVGSLTPEGLRSHNSTHRYDKHVLYAPSDGFLTARASLSGEYTRFGGTSGAAPLVTGAIANLLAVNKSLNLDEVMNLISSRSLKIYNSNQEVSFQILNSYGSLINSLPMDIKNYVINKNKITLPHAVQTIQNHYPECVNNYQIKKIKSDCQDLSIAFDRVRANFFMEPNTDLADIIACVYKKQNKSREAYFYKNWIFSQKKSLAKNLNQQNLNSSILMRNIDLLFSEDAKALVGNWNFEILNRKSDVLAAVFTRADLFADQLTHIFSDLKNKNDKLYLLNNAILFPKARKLLYKLASIDKDFEIRLTSLDVFMNTQDDQLKQDLIFLADEDNERIWNKLINYKKHMSPVIWKQILNKALRSKHENIRSLAKELN